MDRGGGVRQTCRLLPGLVLLGLDAPTSSLGLTRPAFPWAGAGAEAGEWELMRL